MPKTHADSSDTNDNPTDDPCSVLTIATVRPGSCTTTLCKLLGCLCGYLAEGIDVDACVDVRECCVTRFGSCLAQVPVVVELEIVCAVTVVRKMSIFRLQSTLFGLLLDLTTIRPASESRTRCPAQCASFWFSRET